MADRLKFMKSTTTTTTIYIRFLTRVHDFTYNLAEETKSIKSGQFCHVQPVRFSRHDIDIIREFDRFAHNPNGNGKE